MGFKLLILTPGNPFDHKSWSGTLHSITTTIQNMGHKVLWHGKIPRASLFLRIKKILYNLFNGKKYFPIFRKTARYKLNYRHPYTISNG